MRFLRNKTPGYDQLFLKINANRAADLAPNAVPLMESVVLEEKSDSANPLSEQGSEKDQIDSEKEHDKEAKEPPKKSRRGLNPVLVAKMNNNTKKTPKRLNTNQPSWDTSLMIPLKHHDCTQLLDISVWDRRKRYKHYLGEVRFNIKDLFYKNGTFTPETELRWYKLYSSKEYKSFVTGSVLISFELVVKRKKARRKGTPTLRVVAPEEDLYAQLDSLNVSETELTPVDASAEEKETIFKDWQSKLIYSCPSVKPDEQGFYSDSGLNITLDVSDLESDQVSTLSGSSKEREKSLHASVLLKNDASSLSDPSFMSTDVSDSDIADAPVKHKKKRFGRHASEVTNFKLLNRKVLGVIFIEIVSCSDLPPVKNITRTSFDMDPFVVVTFGKKTFRTSWKRHNLNPVFNERIAFEVMDHEANFNVEMLVLDKDRFSFHDHVAGVTLPMKDLSTAATKNTPEDTSENTTDNDDNMVESVKKGRFMKRKKVSVEYADTSKFKTMQLALSLHDSQYVGKYNPTLKIRARFQPYDNLRRDFWRVLLEQYAMNETPGSYDFIELLSLLDALGSPNSDEIGTSFFQKYDRSMWGGDLLTIDEIIDCLEEHIMTKSEHAKVFEFDKCPICCEKRLSKKQDVDIITHVAICASKDWSIVNKLLVSSYVSPQLASRRWFSKVLIKLTYGKYKLGSNSANILVQDRTTGVIMEEKMGVYVRLGIRLLYKGLDKAKTRRVRSMLKRLSIKQGAKFDSPHLAVDIDSFIKFHRLALEECLVTDPTKFATFNEFFYRKLKPGARPIESPNESRIVVSPADCRCTAFATVNRATELWIKGRNFTIAKLFNGNFNNLQDTDLYRPESCTLGIFRLAPQDYHRFHCPVDGRVGEIKFIDGEYYTVNPMAIRSDLDVFGENVRALITLETEHFGTVVMIAVGAMMVGSIILSVKEGDVLKRGDEVGYFKFGGSTIVLLFQKSKFAFDLDLVENSETCIETLIRVGQSIGHSPSVAEHKRDHVDFDRQTKEYKMKLIRVITGGDLDDTNQLSNWEGTNVTNSQDIEELIKTTDEFSDESLINSGQSL